MIENSAVERNDGLKDELRSQSGEPLCAAKNWGEGIPYAVDYIASSVSSNRFLKAEPASGLPCHI